MKSSFLLFIYTNMKKNLLFGLLTILVAGFWFGGISKAGWEITTFDDLKTAIASDQSEITLGSDITVEEPIVITKSITIKWWDHSIGYSNEPLTWSDGDKNYVFKIWSSESDSIEVNLEKITVKNSFYWILDWFTSSNSTKVNLENVIFSFSVV